MKRFAGQVPFVEDIVAGYYCALDPATPMRVRGMLLAAIAYFILPFDFVPDIIAGLGFADDAALFTAVLSARLGAYHADPPCCCRPRPRQRAAQDHVAFSPSSRRKPDPAARNAPEKLDPGFRRGDEALDRCLYTSSS